MVPPSEQPLGVEPPLGSRVTVRVPARIPVEDEVSPVRATVLGYFAVSTFTVLATVIVFDVIAVIATCPKL